MVRPGVPSEGRSLHSPRRVKFIQILLCLALSALLFMNSPTMAQAQILPPDLASKLHTSLNVADLQGSGWIGVSDAGINNPISALTTVYTRISRIDRNGLYNLAPYRVLVMYSAYSPSAGTMGGYGGGQLTTEQLDLIVAFVRGGGGLIVGYEGGGTYSGGSNAVPELLAKLGIVNLRQSATDQTSTVQKDGSSMIDHPVTTGVDKIEVWVRYPVVGLSGAEKFILSPFVAAAKDFGSGRVIFFGDGMQIKKTLSGPRLFANAIEYAAGYTPPGWSPSVDSVLAQKEREIEKLQSDVQKLQAEIQQLKGGSSDLQSLKDENTKLQSRIKELESQIASLQAQVKSLQEQKTQITYIPAQMTGLDLLLLLTTLLFLVTTVYFARRKRNNKRAQKV